MKDTQEEVNETGAEEVILERDNKIWDITKNFNLPQVERKEFFDAIAIYSRFCEERNIDVKAKGLLNIFKNAARADLMNKMTLTKAITTCFKKLT